MGFEILNSKRGTYLSEVDFGLNISEDLKPSGKHDLIVK